MKFFYWRHCTHLTLKKVVYRFGCRTKSLSVLEVSAVLNSVELDVNVDWFGMMIHQPSKGAASFLDSATVERCIL